MELIVGDSRYDICYSVTFSEKISVHKKKKEIEIAFYSDKYQNDPVFTDLVFISKSDVYFWAFEGCEEISREISEFQPFYQEINNRYIKVRFRFKSVYGSTNQLMLSRQIKLGKLLG